MGSIILWCFFGAGSWLGCLGVVFLDSGGSVGIFGKQFVDAKMPSRWQHQHSFGPFTESSEHCFKRQIMKPLTSGQQPCLLVLQKKLGMGRDGECM